MRPAALRAPHSSRSSRAEGGAGGFTLIELIITVAIMTLLAGVMVPAVGTRLQRARDARRLQDLKTVVQAIDDFLYDNGVLPDQDAEVGHGGYDTTLDGTFITQLVRGGYLHESLQDPLNDATHNYRYYHYPAGSAGIATDFYVVGILNFETTAFSAQKGHWQGPGHDWTNDFAYVSGGLSH